MRSLCFALFKRSQKACKIGVAVNGCPTMHLLASRVKVFLAFLTCSSLKTNQESWVTMTKGLYAV